MTITFDGVAYTTKGKCEIHHLNIEGKSETHADGTSSQILSVVTPTLKSLTFVAIKGLTTASFEKHMLDVDVSFTDEDTGTTYHFNEGWVVGTPVYNSENGEISGIDICSNEVVLA